ncbi:MAG: DUF3108 domain-containing protein [Proteobacteria bacterium]|nr:DUF3108 domain-containing protein [Pseudomonadota bacterium]
MKFRHALMVLFLSGPLTGAALAAGGAGGEATSVPGSTLQMAMTLYAGGVTLGKVDLNTTIRGDQYHSVSNLSTSGIVNAFWQSEIQATSNGTVAPKNFHPGLYDSFYTGKSDKKQEVSLTYDASGPARLYADPPYSTTGYEVPPAQQKGTFDPLSAITFFVSGVGAEAGNPCSVLLPVFDGRRRYDVEFVKVKDTTVSLDNGLYKGPAVLCQMKYKQISGYKPRVLKDASKFPLINAWITTMPSAVTGRDYVVPLRVWSNTEYGVIAAVATTLKIDGVTPKR